MLGSAPEKVVIARNVGSGALETKVFSRNVAGSMICKS